MSINLSVYGIAGLNTEAIADLVQSMPGLSAVSSGALADGSAMVRVSRGKQQLPWFTVDGPFAVEDEDLSAEVTARSIGTKWLYQICIEDSSEKTISDADRFSRKLTKATDGVLVDEQTGEVWPKTSKRHIPRPKAAGPVDEIVLRWCYLIDEAPDDVAARYLRLARRFLPESLPRRYGTYEPFQGNLERDGDAGFAEFVNADDSDYVQFYGRFPVVIGSLDGRTRGPGRTRSISLTLDRHAFNDAAWRGALMGFFKAMATELGCFFASAEVKRPGRIISGVMSLQMHEEGYYPASRGQWLGLPAYPVWWSWYAKPYADLVQQHLPGAIQNPDGSIFHFWQEESADRDQLRALLPDPDSPWIPAELSQQRDETTQPAAVMPSNLDG